MASDRPRPRPRADLEVAAGWRARGIRRRRTADVDTRKSGDARWWEELSEREPATAEGRRWRLLAWLRPPDG